MNESIADQSNRVLLPPVPPIGLEYLSASLVKGGHDLRLLDLTFHNDVVEVIDEVVSAFMRIFAGDGKEC